MSAIGPMPRLALDHLVLAAGTLEDGLDWCERAFGLRPEAGGRHDFMGTHNRVFPIGSDLFPRAYFEIIAIDPGARSPRWPRWFDLDEPVLVRALEARGPQLVHWVARCDSIDAAGATFGALGIETGQAHPARRDTPEGLLEWRIGVRDDGRRPLGGAVPALIEWGPAHPTDTMAASGVALRSLRVAGWPEPLRLLLPEGVDHDSAVGAPALQAVLSGPLGPVALDVFNPGN